MCSEEWECPECFHIYKTSKREVGDCPFCRIASVSAPEKI